MVKDNIHDSAAQLEQLACYRVDRALADVDNTWGAGSQFTPMMHSAGMPLWYAKTAHHW